MIGATSPNFPNTHWGDNLHKNKTYPTSKYKKKNLLMN
jgi:hypothetical protein